MSCVAEGMVSGEGEVVGGCHYVGGDVRTCDFVMRRGNSMSNKLDWYENGREDLK